MKKYMLGLVVLLFLFGCEQLQGETATPGIDVRDQIVLDTVQVDLVSSNSTGWVAIYNERDGQPDQLIGFTQVEAGENRNITVNITQNRITSTMYAVLHNDRGEEGRLEFPGPDAPVMVDGSFVAQTFRALGEATDETAQNDTEDTANDTITPVPSTISSDNETEGAGEDDNETEDIATGNETADDTTEDETADETTDDETDEAIDNTSENNVLEYSSGDDGLEMIARKISSAVSY
ncbi:MAG TPA: hypothetical protein VFF28_03045 [Candidatus Nanoarchaeia archaeon]|nr:hypothetical protein [Candidatus Nanoarchaeia archaeon]